MDEWDDRPIVAIAEPRARPKAERFYRPSGLRRASGDDSSRRKSLPLILKTQAVGI